MMATDEMTPDKAVRYACRALTEERTEVERSRHAEWMAKSQSTDRDYLAYATRRIAEQDERLANLDAAMRVLRGMAEG